MAMTGLDTFDTSVQKSEKWIKEIMERLGWDNRHRAYIALRAVLLALREHLTIDESANLSAQLPLVIRGMYYDQWKPSSVPSKDRKREGFLEHIKAQMPPDESVDAEQVARAVLEVVREHITEGEIEDIEGMLPRELAAMW